MKQQQLESFRKIAGAYYRLKIKQEELKESFEKEKQNFYSEMSKFWNKNKIQEKSFSDSLYQVSKFQPVKTIFDVEKVKKKLSKEQLKKCVTKTVNLVDSQGLFNLLRDKGILFKEVKDFFEIKEEINQKAIDKMYDLGEIDKEDLSGCYEVVVNEPYYKIIALESNDNGEEK